MTVDEALPEIGIPESSDESCADSLAARAEGAMPTTATMHAAEAAEQAAKPADVAGRLLLLLWGRWWWGRHLCLRRDGWILA